VKTIGVLSTGLVTSVGLSAPAACAAIRAGLTNPTETHFIDSSGERIQAHQVPLSEPWLGRIKLVKMATMAIAEGLAAVPRQDWQRIPLLLCVAEPERPGRLKGLDEEVLFEIERELNVQFSEQSRIIPQGRISIGVALMQAQQLIADEGVPFVLIAATDSLITWPTLSVYESDNRLLTPANSNGFMPGEGASALLVAEPPTETGLCCTGLGFATESAHIDSGEPLRAEGLSQAIKGALGDAGCEMHDLDLRITDLSGEHYYFKEAALALSRTLRRRKEEFDLWHPAECIGEAGAVAGLAMIAVAHAACHRRYARANNLLWHAGNDSGARAAGVLQFRA